MGDKVVGGANWNTYAEDPYPKPMDRPLEASWWPEAFVGRSKREWNNTDAEAPLDYSWAGAFIRQMS